MAVKSRFNLMKIMKKIVRSYQKSADLTITTKIDDLVYRPFKDIPKLNPPLISQLYNMLTSSKKETSNDMMDSVNEFEKSDGIHLMNKWPFVKPDVLLTDPSMCKQMYIHGVNPRIPIRKAIIARKYYFESRKTTALSACQGQYWRKLRSAVQPLLLEPKYTKHYNKAMIATSEQFVELIDLLRDENTDELPSDLYEIVQRWCIETLGRVTLNHKFGCLDLNLPHDSIGYQLHKTHLRLFSQMHILEQTIMWRYWPTASRRNFYKDMDFIMSVVRNLIEDAKFHDNKSLDDHDDIALVNFLLEKDVSAEDSTALIVDLMSGGIETVANTVIATLYCFATNTECQDKVKHEIDLVTSAKQTNDEKHTFQYLNACIRESMRLLPIVSANTRTLQSDTIIGEYQVPKGTTVIAAHGVIGRMAKYFEEPDKFRPERWLFTRKHHPFAVRPFGHGARICVAKRLADQMLEIVLAKLVHKYHFTWSGGPIQMKFQLHRQIQSPLQFLCVKRTKN